MAKLVQVTARGKEYWFAVDFPEAGVVINHRFAIQDSENYFQLDIEREIMCLWEINNGIFTQRSQILIDLENIEEGE